MPGPIDTNFRDFMPTEVREAFEADVVGRVPVVRAGPRRPPPSGFPPSDEASIVTGAQYSVDGGPTMR